MRWPCVLLATVSAFASDPSSLVSRLQALRGVKATVEQSCESAVYSNLSRRGSLLLGGGGTLRLQYEKGMLVVCDGQVLTQYDPVTRTAQQMDVATAVKDMPLVALLVRPARLQELFTASSPREGVLTLVPKQKGSPSVDITFKDNMPWRIQWQDRTEAKQVLTLTGMRTGVAHPAGTFTFAPPKGTRWAH